MQMNKIIAFFKQHSIITTLLEIAIVAVILCTGVIFWLDSYTRHGTATIVPSVRYLSVTEASDILSRKGFRCEVIDSLFNDRVTPGVVVEQTPDAESRVKEGRTIYLTINAYSPKKVTMPTLIDGSARQAQAILRALGFTNILVEYEPSPYKDLVLDVLCNGRQVESGEKIPLTSRITLIVGMGDMPTDSLSSRSASTDSARWFPSRWSETKLSKSTSVRSVFFPARKSSPIVKSSFPSDLRRNSRTTPPRWLIFIR